ncbi:cell envelope biogenesis protein TolA [Aquabacter spiritensis]|uniref:Cell division and transport-associated protein TolA n=1 Tax=Aquabacter spiritensis TaxID=933073 RepID=A0A4R3M343_9HYPH|nr:cell envelope biogenesis protein TolA [Aquabacter spiritensis]TCT05575.1 cell division and transport-associated protein TolA [Aquabacter spiritensis]
MRAGLITSTVLHGGVLVLALATFASPRPFDTPVDTIPVEVVSAADVSKVTKGAETGKKDEPPKTVAEKIDAEKPTPDPALKVTEKQEVAPTSAAPPPPPPPPQPKAEDQKPAPAPPKAEPPPPQADEALKADPDPKPQQQAQPAPMPPKKPPPPPKVAEQRPPTDQAFNADKIAALLDKRTPQRAAATGSQLSPNASFGAPRGNAAAVSLSEQDAFREKVRQCWRMPHINDDRIFAYIELNLNRDGTLAATPTIVEGPALTPDQTPVFQAFVSSAVRALIQCQPYTMFRAETYDQWRSIQSRFYPNMFGGA